jgi:putative transposase
MKKSRFTTEQIIAILKESEAGAATKELCRQHGISEQTFYRWKSKYSGMEAGDARRLRELEDENRRLKQMVADQALDIQALKDVLKKKW